MHGGEIITFSLIFKVEFGIGLLVLKLNWNQSVRRIRSYSVQKSFNPDDTNSKNAKKILFKNSHFAWKSREHHCPSAARNMRRLWSRWPCAHVVFNSLLIQADSNSSVFVFKRSNLWSSDFESVRLYNHWLVSTIRTISITALKNQIFVLRSENKSNSFARIRNISHAKTK